MMTKTDLIFTWTCLDLSRQAVVAEPVKRMLHPVTAKESENTLRLCA